jgi:phage terminase small subunit
VGGKEASKLTEKQKRFADEYLIDLNATAAYKRAGYAGKGKTAGVNAARMLVNARTAAYIASKQVILQEKTGITQERVLAEYAKLAFLDPRKFYNAAGNLIPIHLLDDDTAAALGGMDVTASSDGQGGVDYTKKIKIIDKKGALDSIARTLGMFQDKVDATISGDVTITSIKRTIVKMK